MLPKCPLLFKVILNGSARTRVLTASQRMANLQLTELSVCEGFVLISSVFFGLVLALEPFENELDRSLVNLIRRLV
jgi:hypothetical protein